MKRETISFITKNQNKPSLYESSTAPFWNDSHISKMMLDAHLNESFDAATRVIETVDKTIDFINVIAPVNSYKKYLDLGCGPGIYTQKMYNLGYQVTGIDISKRSIDYAVEQAQINKQDIRYINKDYTTLLPIEKFDLITMIYCDYGVLSKKDRYNLLQFIQKSLTDEGVFIFDIFTPYQHLERKDQTSFYAVDSAGFWSAEPHVVLESKFFYENNVLCNQYLVITETEEQVYRVWDQQFTIDEIAKELEENGLIIVEQYSDLTGKKYQSNSNIIGLVIKKAQN